MLHAVCHTLPTPANLLAGGVFFLLFFLRLRSLLALTRAAGTSAALSRARFPRWGLSLLCCLLFFFVFLVALFGIIWYYLASNDRHHATTDLHLPPRFHLPALRRSRSLAGFGFAASARRSAWCRHCWRLARWFATCHAKTTITFLTVRVTASANAPHFSRKELNNDCSKPKPFRARRQKSGNRPTHRPPLRISLLRPSRRRAHRNSKIHRAQRPALGFVRLPGREPAKPGNALAVLSRRRRIDVGERAPPALALLPALHVAVSVRVYEPGT